MKSFFSFNKSQKIGVFVISSIIVSLIIVLNRPYQSKVESPFVFDKSNYFDFSQKNKDSSVYKSYKTDYKKYSRKKIHYSNFDPNKYLVEDWMKIGFSNKQAQIIVNIKNKNKGFSKKEDLKNIFVISDEKYKEMESYIFIESDFQNLTISKININSANEEELISLKGIGQVLSKRIVKYRESLGGFYDMNQLLEIYGVSEDVLINNENILFIDESEIIKINVNTLSLNELKTHPYISWDIAAAIVEKRQFQNLQSLNFLIEKKIMTEKDLEKLNHYISF